jgi:hypothetical protein
VNKNVVRIGILATANVENPLPVIDVNSSI